MKNVNNLLFFMVVSFILFSCQNDEFVKEEEITVASTSEDNFLNELDLEIYTDFKEVDLEPATAKKYTQYMEYMGFNTAFISFFKDFLVVENDLLLSYEKIENGIKELKSGVAIEKQRFNLSAFNSTDLNRASDITVSIANFSFFGGLSTLTVGANWRNAIIQGVNEWNNLLGTLIRFRLTSDNDPNADIFIYSPIIPNNENGAIIFGIASGTGFIPNGNRGTIILNKSLESNSSFSSLNKKLTVIHELGHTIGFFHTNEPFGDLVDCTNQFDSNSIMNATRPIDNTRITTFSPLDEIAIVNIYRENNPITIFPSGGFAARDSRIQIEWDWTRVGSLFSNVEIRLLQGGTAKLVQQTSNDGRHAAFSESQLLNFNFDNTVINGLRHFECLQIELSNPQTGEKFDITKTFTFIPEDDD